GTDLLRPAAAWGKRAILRSLVKALPCRRGQREEGYMATPAPVPIVGRVLLHDLHHGVLTQYHILIRDTKVKTMPGSLPDARRTRARLSCLVREGDDGARPVAPGLPPRQQASQKEGRTSQNERQISQEEPLWLVHGVP